MVDCGTLSGTHFAFHHRFSHINWLSHIQYDLRSVEKLRTIGRVHSMCGDHSDVLSSDRGALHSPKENNSRKGES